MVAMVSLTDKANKEYIHEERTFPFKECTFSRERLEIISPVTTLTGDSQEMEVAGKLPDSRGEIHAILKNCGPALNNCGNGMFQRFNAFLWASMWTGSAAWSWLDILKRPAQRLSRKKGSCATCISYFPTTP